MFILSHFIILFNFVWLFCVLLPTFIHNQGNFTMNIWDISEQQKTSVDFSTEVPIRRSTPASQGYKDSNLEMTESESVALPFGDSPIWSAGGGIRTHAPLRTNGFQDRLVMTTSIPLHESGWWESNPRIQLGRLVFYHWTTPACRWNGIVYSIGVTGFEPAASWSQTRRSSQAEPHPEGFVCVLSVTQELVYSKGKNMSTTFFIFLFFSCHKTAFSNVI